MLAHCHEPHSGLVALLAALPVFVVARGLIGALWCRLGFALAMLLLRMGQWLEYWGAWVEFRGFPSGRVVVLSVMLYEHAEARKAMRKAWRRA